MLELAVLLAVSIIGQSAFAPFEIETPVWRKLVKWAIVVGLTLAVSRVVGHWSLLVPVLGGIAGVTGHTIWCRKNNIDPWHATPRKKYYALRGWTWQE